MVRFSAWSRAASKVENSSGAGGVMLVTRIVGSSGHVAIPQSRFSNRTLTIPIFAPVRVAGFCIIEVDASIPSTRERQMGIYR